MNQQFYVVFTPRNAASGSIDYKLPLNRGDMALRFTMTPQEARELLAPRQRSSLERQVEDGVHAIDRSLGRAPDAASERLSAALYAECRAQGFDRIDGVVLGQKGTKAEAGEYVFAYRGRPEQVSDWVAVRTAEAVQTPVEQSLARAQALEQQQARDAHLQPAFARQQDTDAPSRSLV